MGTKNKETARREWQSWRAKHRPYVVKACAKCGKPFTPGPGCQLRCDACRTLVCKQCGNEFISKNARAVQQFCSYDCKGLSQKGVEPKGFVKKRGRRPRTYARTRNKHGSAEDREWRQAVFERDKFTCQECGQVGGQLQADHIKSFSEHVELRHELLNGRTLCLACHRKTPTYGWRGYWLKRRG